MPALVHTMSSRPKDLDETAWRVKKTARQADHDRADGHVEGKIAFITGEVVG